MVRVRRSLGPVARSKLKPPPPPQDCLPLLAAVGMEAAEPPGREARREGRQWGWTPFPPGCPILFPMTLAWA